MRVPRIPELSQPLICFYGGFRARIFLRMSCSCIAMSCFCGADMVGQSLSSVVPGMRLMRIVVIPSAVSTLRSRGTGAGGGGYL